MKIAIVNKQDLSIASWYEADADDQGRYGGPWGQPEQFAHVELASGDPRAMKAVLIEAIEADPEAEPPVEAEAERIELQADEDLEDAAAEQDLEALRSQRNLRLEACDWTQLPDSPLSVEDKALWSAYRQELRDLPENTEDALNPEWPEQP